jgi:hypothetical protein
MLGIAIPTNFNIRRKQWQSLNQSHALLLVAATS